MPLWTGGRMIPLLHRGDVPLHYPYPEPERRDWIRGLLFSPMGR